jgi:hypothetical protein
VRSIAKSEYLRFFNASFFRGRGVVDLTVNWVVDQQEKIRKKIFDEAGATKVHLELLLEHAKKICGDKVTVNHGPLKGIERAMEKIRIDYLGDAYDLKDVVRSTVIATNGVGILEFRASIEKLCIARNSLSLIKNEEVYPHKDTNGYSGLNLVVRFKNGRTGEIQVNSANIMYGKMSKDRFESTFENGQTLRRDLEVKYKIAGGMGHGLYEIQRINKEEAGAEASMLSRRYYAHLRQESPNSVDAKQIQSDLLKFSARDKLRDYFPRQFIGINRATLGGY